MTKVKYVGDAQNEVPEDFQAFGVNFNKGKATNFGDLSDAQQKHALAKFQGNPHFEVQGAKEAPEPKPLPREPGVPTPLDGAVEDPRDKTPVVDGKK